MAGVTDQDMGLVIPRCEEENNKYFSVVTVHLLIWPLIQMAWESQRSLQFDAAKILLILYGFLHETCPAVVCSFFLCSPPVTDSTFWSLTATPHLTLSGGAKGRNTMIQGRKVTGAKEG